MGATSAPYLTLITEEAPQRTHSLREVFNGLRWIVRAGARVAVDAARPRRPVKTSINRRNGGCRLTSSPISSMICVSCCASPLGRNAQPSTSALDSRTLQSTPESGARAAYDGAKRRKGSKAHIAVDTLGHLLALHVRADSEQDRAQVAELTQQVQAVTGESVKLAFVNQGCTGEMRCRFEQIRIHQTAIESNDAGRFNYRNVPHRLSELRLPSVVQTNAVLNVGENLTIVRRLILRRDGDHVEQIVAVEH